MNKLFIKLIQFILLIFTLVIPIFQCSWQSEDEINLKYDTKPDRISQLQLISLTRDKRYGYFFGTNILSMIIQARRERMKKYGLGFQILARDMKRWVRYDVLRKQKGILFDDYEMDQNETVETTTIDEEVPKTESINEETSEEPSEVIPTTEIENSEQTITDTEVPVQPDPINITPRPPKEPKNLTVVYTDYELKELCEDPEFDSVDTNLDDTEVLIFKGVRFYVMENLRYGSGNLIASGKTKQLLPGFDDTDFTAIVTIKEGPERGNVYAFYSDQSYMVWKPSGTYLKAQHTIAKKREKSITLPMNGFSAALHNRNIENPLIIGFNGSQVYYYDTLDKKLVKSVEWRYDKSPEQFPPGLTAATSLKNGFIYVFRGDKYCVREMTYESEDKDQYCDFWHDNKRFLGCYGRPKPPYSIINYGLNEKDTNTFLGDLCDDLNINDITRAIDGTVYLFRDDKYWVINGFPNDIKIIDEESTREKWPGIKSSPDVAMIVQEGPFRGQMLVFKGITYNQWSVDGHTKAEDKKLMKLTAILQNSDLMDPIVIGFGEKNFIYLSANKGELKITKKFDYVKSNLENWPKNITGALFVNEDIIYLFNKDKYCVRGWKCTKTSNQCVSCQAHPYIAEATYPPSFSKNGTNSTLKIYCNFCLLIYELAGLVGGFGTDAI